MRRARFLLPSLFVVLCALIAPAAVAADAVPTEMDPVKAARAVKLAEKLRCLVCQNQTIADSNAELANDLRTQIREQIAAGKTDDEILDYMVARYGDFVLYRPPLKATTVMLWLGPLALLLVGAGVFWTVVRKRAPKPEGEPSPGRRAEIEALLDEREIRPK
jgi:cytochrome c-type biogenesis protein CcmH